MAETSVIASVLQIADIGVRLSVKLYTVCHAVANADDSFTFKSKHLSRTSAILIEHSQCPQEDLETQLCAEDAYRTTNIIANGCRIVFKGMDRYLMGNVTMMGTDGSLIEPRVAVFERSI